MNTTITNVHNAMRNYRSLLTRDLSGKANSAQTEKASGKQLKEADTVEISQEGVERLKAFVYKPDSPRIEDSTHPERLVIDGVSKTLRQT